MFAEFLSELFLSLNPVKKIGIFEVELEHG